MKEISLLKRIIIVYTCLAILPAFLLVIFLSVNQFNRLYSDTLSGKQLALKQITQSMNTALLSAEDISQSLAYRSPISELISRDNLNAFPIWTKRSTEESIEALKYTLKYQNLGIEEILIYTNKSELATTSFFYQESLLYSFPFYKNFRSQKYDKALYYLDNSETKQYYEKKGGVAHSDGTLLFVRKIQDETNDVYSGILVFEINPTKFLSNFSSTDSKENEYTFYFTNTKTFLGSSIDKQIIMDIQSSPKKDVINLTNLSTKYQHTKLKGYDLLIIDKETLEKKAYLFLALRIFIIFFFLLIIQILGLHYLIQYIQRKINKNMNEMDAIIADGFKGTIEENEQDEFKFITIRFNKLLQKIQTLVADILTKERERKDAQIKALQYQIDPHFIYNTISIFASIADENHNFELAEAISYFGHLLRYNIKKDGGFATIKDELDNAYALNKVYSIRYREQLELVQNVASDLYQVKIIKYLLQPIIENAILHGGRNNQVKMMVSLSIERIADNLVITITDDGKGMETTQLERIRQHLLIDEGAKKGAENKSTSIGLVNVYRRLQLIYGESATLNIASEPAQGTTVTVTIPWNMLEKRNQLSNQ